MIQLVLVALALLGLPLFVVIALSVFVSYSGSHQEFLNFFNDPEELFDKAHLLPIPLFTFAGFLLARSKAPERLVRLADALLGWAPGGLAVVSIAACTFFTTFTGASGVTIIALGGLLYPVLLERRYGEKYSLGVLTASGSLGLLFFPALPVFIYAVVYGLASNSGLKPSDLFLAGLLPGILLTAVLVVHAVRIGVLQKIERKKFVAGEIWPAFKGAFFEAMIPVLLLGLLMTGKASLNELATLTCVYLVLVEMVIHRDIHPTRDLPRLVAEAMVLVGAIVLIMTAVMPATDLLKEKEVARHLFEWFSQFVTSKLAFLMVLNLFLLVVGCLMDIFSAIVAVLPLLVPMAQEFHIHPLHLGVVFLANLEIGYLTPPVGMNLFISSFQFRKPVLTVYRAVLPFIGMLFAALLVITYVPALSTWLPEKMGYKLDTTAQDIETGESAADLERLYGEDPGGGKDDPGKKPSGDGDSGGRLDGGGDSGGMLDGGGSGGDTGGMLDGGDPGGGDSGGMLDGSSGGDKGSGGGKGKGGGTPSGGDAPSDDGML